MLDTTHITTLLGGSATGAGYANVSQLVTGKTPDITSAVLGGALLQQTKPSLSPVQKDALANLETYVQENVSGEDAEALMLSIASLRKLMEHGAEGNGSLDPVFSLISGNPDLKVAFPSGVIIDGVL